MSYDEITFEVNGRLLCSTLAAVALFQGTPRQMGSEARVDAFAGHGGLALVASNGVSAAAGHVAIDGLDGAGVFFLPYASVKALLAVFDRGIPKGRMVDEYALEVRVSSERLEVRDISRLFDHDQLVIAVPPEDDGPAGDSYSQRAMRAAAVMRAAVLAADELDLADGVYFSHGEVARLARAAKMLGTELMLRPRGRMLMAPLSPDFTAFTCAQQRDQREEKRPFLDDRAVLAWGRRLDSLVEDGVL